MQTVTLLTGRLRVRVLSEEPNLSTTSFLRLLVNDRQASTPQNGQYLRNEDTLRGRLGLGYSPRIPPRRWFGSTFSDSPARVELLVNGHQFPIYEGGHCSFQPPAVNRSTESRPRESWGLWTSSNLRVPESSDAVQTGDNKIEGVLVVLLNTV